MALALSFDRELRGELVVRARDDADESNQAVDDVQMGVFPYIDYEDEERMLYFKWKSKRLWIYASIRKGSGLDAPPKIYALKKIFGVIGSTN